MRRLLFAVALAVALAQCVSAQMPHKKLSAKPAETSKALSPLRQFVGTWKLVSSLQTQADGSVRPYGFGAHPAGYLMYDATGHMCAQVVNGDRPKWKDPDHPTADEIKTAYDGFGGYCGTYTVDEAASTMSHLPQVPFDPNLVGESKPRNYRFEDDHLIYSGKDKTDEGEVHWEMIWERVR